MNTDMSEAGGRERLLSLLNRIDNKNLLIAELILEIHRLQQLCRVNGINPLRSRAAQSPEKDTPEKA